MISCSTMIGNMFTKQELSTILNITDIKHNGSIESIVKATQNLKTGWIRTGERWEHKTKFNNFKQNLLIFHLLKKLNYTDEIKPSKTNYDTAILLGATAPTVTLRLKYMSKCWSEYNIRWKQIVVLSSDRALATSYKVKENKIINILNNTAGKAPIEIEMMKYVYNTSKLPKSLSKIPVIWINAKTPKGKQRTSTSDSVKVWVKAYQVSVGKNILVFSNNPYIGYQNKTLETYLKSKKVLIETVGPKASNNSIDNYLDALARELYQTQILLKQCIM